MYLIGRGIDMRVRHTHIDKLHLRNLFLTCHLSQILHLYIYCVKWSVTQ